LKKGIHAPLVAAEKLFFPLRRIARVILTLPVANAKDLNSPATDVVGKWKMEIKQSIDAIQFLKDQMAHIKDSVSYAYPDGFLDVERTHATLQSIKQIANSTKSFLDNIKAP
jgi:hypothetical protein